MYGGAPLPHEGQPVGLGRPGGRRGEEVRVARGAHVVGEDAGEGAGEEVRVEEVVGVDEVAPRRADAPELGEGAAGEAPEDFDEHVVGEIDVGAAVQVHGHGSCCYVRHGKSKTYPRSTSMQCMHAGILTWTWTLISDHIFRLQIKAGLVYSVH